MTGLQEKLLELLCEIEEICKKHDIEYMLFAGTALGAERHHGFIPWDDDADIIMTLDNYEKFIRVAEKELPEGRVLNALENGTDGYFLTYARYVNVNTTAIQRHTAFGGCDPGVKIDIFCAVPTYNKLEKAEQHKQKILAFSEAVLRYGLMYTHRADAFYPLFKAEQKKLVNLGREKYIRKTMKRLKLRWKRNPKYYVLFSGMMSDSYILDAKLLDQVKYVPFEDTMLPISTHNIEFSKVLYGEGWINIPDNVEKPRHTLLLDLKEPYSKYIELLKKSDTYREKEQLVLKRRELHLKEREEFRDITINRQKVLNLAVGMGVVQKFKMLSAEEKEDMILLNDLFSAYYQTQLNRNNKYYHLIIDLEEEVFDTAIKNAVLMGNYETALEILKLTEKSAGFSNVSFDSYYKLIEQCIAVTEMMYLSRDIVLLEKELQKIESPLVRESLIAVVAKLWIEFNHCANEKDYSSLCDKIEAQKDAFGEIGELTALKGLCLEKTGEFEAAAVAYQQAIKTVRKALVFQQLLDRGYNPYEEE